MPGPPAALAPADVFAYVLADLVVILVAARIVGALFVRIGQPRVVGEIIAGVLIGPTVLGGNLATPGMPGRPGVDGAGLVNDLYPIQAFAFLNLLGQIALVFFMFLVGLELDRRLLKGKGKQIASMSIAVVAVPVGLGFAAAAVMSADTWRPAGIGSTTFALFLGAGLSVTAFPVMARILQEKGLMATSMGAVGVGSAAVVTVLMFLAIAAASASAKGSGVVETVGLKLVLTIGLLVALAVVGRPVMGLVTRGWAPGRPAGTMIAIMLMGALGVALAADRIGINALVGGFLFGLIIPAREGLSDAVIDRMQDAVVLFLLPVFLAVSGLRTDLKVLRPALVPGLVVFLVLMVVGKWGVGFVAGRAVGLGAPQAHLLGVLMNCRGLLILVVGLIGLQLGVITKATQAVFVIGAVVTTLMTGPLVDVFVRKVTVPAEADRRVSGSAALIT